MRALIRCLDRLLRRFYGIFEFCNDPTCLFRLRIRQLAHVLSLPEGEIPAGALILELHLWNEHIPLIPAEGFNLAWATQVRRMLINSFQAVAWEIQRNPDLAGVQAVGGIMVFPGPDNDHARRQKLMQRLGFTVLPYQSPLGRFGEFWENLYTWGLIWTFQQASLQRRWGRLHRIEVWMSVNQFLRHYNRRNRN